MEITNSFVKAIRPVGFLLVASFLVYGGFFITVPFLPDILVQGLCPGKKECSEVAFFTGALQLGAAMGTVSLAPILGRISDDYGRKPVFLLILFTSVLPPVVLAYSTTRTVIYVWFPLMMIAVIVREGGLIPVLLASVADVVDEDHRSTAVGWALATLSVGALLGTFTALLTKTIGDAIWTTLILQVSTAIYVNFVVKETNPRRPFLPANQSQSESAMKLLPKSEMKGENINLRQTAWTVWKSRRLMIIAVVDFLNKYGMNGLEAFTVYYLKAVFDYGKNEIALLYIVGEATGVLGQMSVYPVLAPVLGDRGVLRISLLGAAAHYLLYGLAWAPWVPYLAAGMEILHSITQPALGTMVSRGVNRQQQGKVQGFMGAVRGGAGILGPLTITPLTAAAFGENPPFHMIGFPFVICGGSMVVAWLFSIGLPPLTSAELSAEPTVYNQALLPPEDSPEDSAS